MLNAVEVITRRGTQLYLPLEGDDISYVVTNIEGLDPVKATLVSSSVAGEDGARFQSSRREARNIKITLELDPDWNLQTAEDLRQALYPYLMPKSTVELRIWDTDGTAVEIAAQVESLTANPFAREPAVDVSLMCFNPDFLSPDPVVFNAASTADSSQEVVLNYSGTVETGVLFSLKLLRDISSFTIYHRLPWGERRSVAFTTQMLVNDLVTISSVPGEKGAYIERNGTKLSRLYGIPPTAPWLVLEPGENKFSVLIAGAPLLYDITYTARYGGL